MNYCLFGLDQEHIWILILQAVAFHVDKNAEKIEIKIRIDIMMK